MTLDVNYQENFSRVELLLRTFFGFLYIVLPHTFLLLFVSLASGVVTLIAFWVILFTGSYPESFFEFQVKALRWNTRVNLRMYNLVDGYPAFGLNAVDDSFKLEVPYPETVSRGLTLVKLLFGAFYVALPHGIVLMFRLLWTSVLIFIAFWVVLFTGSYPQSWHEFNVGTLRWSIRVNLYLSYMSDTYPPFSGRA